ncbi:hypothetical protein CALVIDRAFT_538341 [Calocera viscosa TUFC12733]|uniref:Secreted protein n=1 Tax=Calocera viscosa (strain TUFC12733) TaxID=1330018 RepID=A0A167L073_CALVF|nr:hypothetical protein CALVIDRAFT_538341 [Calocera viscosa TUFC12733]
MTCAAWMACAQWGAALLRSSGFVGSRPVTGSFVHSQTTRCAATTAPELRTFPSRFQGQVDQGTETKTPISCRAE